MNDLAGRRTLAAGASSPGRPVDDGPSSTRWTRARDGLPYAKDFCENFFPRCRVPSGGLPLPGYNSAKKSCLCLELAGQQVVGRSEGSCRQPLSRKQPVGVSNQTSFRRVNWVQSATTPRQPTQSVLPDSSLTQQMTADFFGDTLTSTASSERSLRRRVTMAKKSKSKKRPVAKAKAWPSRRAPRKRKPGR